MNTFCIFLLSLFCSTLIHAAFLYDDNVDYPSLGIVWAEGKGDKKNQPKNNLSIMTPPPASADESWYTYPTGGAACTLDQETKISADWKRAIQVVSIAQMLHKGLKPAAGFTPNHPFVSFIAQRDYKVFPDALNTKTQVKISTVWEILDQAFDNILTRFGNPAAVNADKILVTCYQRYWERNGGTMIDTCDDSGLAVTYEAMWEDLEAARRFRRPIKMATINFCPKYFTYFSWEDAVANYRTLDEFRCRVQVLIHEWFHVPGILPHGIIAEDFVYTPTYCREMVAKTDAIANDPTQGKHFFTPRYSPSSADNDAYYTASMVLDGIPNFLSGKGLVSTSLPTTPPFVWSQAIAQKMQMMLAARMARYYTPYNGRYPAAMQQVPLVLPRA